jgi:hypothetical protein
MGDGQLCSVLSLQSTVSKHAQQFEPLHVPGALVCPALDKWSWTNGLKRMRDVAGSAVVEVRRCLQAGSLRAQQHIDTN